jgi:hypothetical protein
MRKLLAGAALAAVLVGSVACSRTVERPAGPDVNRPALVVLCRLPVDDLAHGAYVDSDGPLAGACDWSQLGLANCEEDELCALVNGPHHPALTGGTR